MSVTLIRGTFENSFHESLAFQRSLDAYLIKNEIASKYVYEHFASTQPAILQSIEIQN